VSDWAYVFAGWLVTILVIAGYWLWVATNTRRAAREVARLEDDA
jgi:uncharacterized membrane protein YciS (DUF1049 family)